MNKTYFKIIGQLGTPFFIMLLFVITGDVVLSLSFIIYLLTLASILYIKNPKGLLHYCAQPFKVDVTGKKTNIINYIAAIFTVLGTLVISSAVKTSDTSEGLEYNLFLITVATGAYLIFVVICLLSRRWYQKNVMVEVEKFDDVVKYIEIWEKEEKKSVWTFVAEFNEGKDAHEAKEFLESNGIEVYLYGDNAPAHLGSSADHTMPVRLYVHRCDKEAAERLIKG